MCWVLFSCVMGLACAKIVLVFTITYYVGKLRVGGHDGLIDFWSSYLYAFAGSKADQLTT